MNGSISTILHLSLSARSTASALAEPFYQPVFCLRESAKSARESAVHICEKRVIKQKNISGKTDLMLLWLTPQTLFHCMYGNIAVSLHKIQRRSAKHSNKLDDFALVCRIFAESFEKQVKGLNERRNIIGAHI